MTIGELRKLIEPLDEKTEVEFEVSGEPAELDEALVMQRFTGKVLLFDVMKYEFSG